jgi:16S rRNA A1518/A1519 N6-dimethyltransferase RsmA/KsgA/DIM1 with predicted DNA glycosylase/AP lyase activity
LLLLQWLTEIYHGIFSNRHTRAGGYPEKPQDMAESVLDSRLRGNDVDEELISAAPYNFLTLMFQKEVVDRLVARPNTKDYGRLSIITQWLCEAEPLFDLPPSAFTPPPKVTSTVVKLTPRTSPEPCALADLEKVTATAFGQRRKMLRVSLKPLGGEALLEQAGILPTLRAEDLTVADFIRLARLIG